MPQRNTTLTLLAIVQRLLAWPELKFLQTQSRVGSFSVCESELRSRQLEVVLVLAQQVCVRRLRQLRGLQMGIVGHLRSVRLLCAALELAHELQRCARAIDQRIRLRIQRVLRVLRHQQLVVLGEARVQLQVDELVMVRFLRLGIGCLAVVAGFVEGSQLSLDLLLHRGRSHVEALPLTRPVPLLRPLVAGLVDLDEAALSGLNWLLSCVSWVLVDLDLGMRDVEFL